jgi:hypothetical protein
MLIIQKQIEAPMFGLRNWQAADYKKPIEFHLEGAKTRIRLVEESHVKTEPEQLQIAMNLWFSIRTGDPRLA